MFTDSIIESGTLLVASGTLLVAFWILLGRRVDARLFIALNFSLMSVWVCTSDSDARLRAETALYIALVVAACRLPASKRIEKTLGRVLEFESAWIALGIATITLIINLRSGLTSNDDVRVVLEARSDDPLLRYFSYISGANIWLVAHCICRAASRGRWKRQEVGAVVMAGAAAATGLSKASFLPVLVTLVFVYYPKLGWRRAAAIAAVGVTGAFALVTRMYDNADMGFVAQVFFRRIVGNVDVLDYIEDLSGSALQYPHASPFFPAWPVYQWTRTDFVVPGVWLYGSATGNWSGFGPNPTFVADHLIAACGAGLVFAPLMGMVLKAASKSPYRVLVALAVYSALQDWYRGCADVAVFGVCVLAMSAYSRFAQQVSRPVLST